MENDIRTIIVNLPTTVKGFCYTDSSGLPCIVINARMTHEIQKKTYLHEKRHIMSGDIDNKAYHEYAEAL